MNNIHNLLTIQTFTVSESDTIKTNTGVSIPVSRIINLGLEEEWEEGDLTIIKLHNKYLVVIKPDYSTCEFSLVLKEEDKSSPVSGNLEASLEADKYQTNTTVSKTEEAIMKKHIASLYSRVSNLEKTSNTSESDEALASKTPNHSILGSKILYSDTEIQSNSPTTDKYYTEADLTLEQCKTLEKEFNNRVLCLKMSDTVWIDVDSYLPVKDLAKARKGESLLTNGKPIQITKLNPCDFLKEPGNYKPSKFTLYIRPETASDNDKECKYLESLKGHWSKLPNGTVTWQTLSRKGDIEFTEDRTASDSETSLNWDKAEQEVRISILEQEINALKSAIKHLNSKTDKILKLIFKD